MSGLFGVAGREEALPILLEGLSGLSYRGYDSAGVAVHGGNRIEIRKAVGPLEGLRALLEEQPISGMVGIGHVRWATHGTPTDANAHPHADSHGRFAVAHNGTLQNSIALREWLSLEGFRFVSETDTEAIAHLLARFWRGDLYQAVRDIVPHLRGSFAFCALCRDAKDTLCAVRRGASLAVGIAEGVQYVSSDVPALMPFTRDVLFLRDGEIAMVSPDGCAVFSGAGERVEAAVVPVRWTQEPPPEPTRHHMLREIEEQPAVLGGILAHFTEAREGRLALRADRMPLRKAHIRKDTRLWLIGGGSAYHAAVAGKGIIEGLAGLPALAEMASEFRARQPLLGPHDICLFLSQSGETQDTLAALALVRGKNPAFALVNAPGSTLSREADAVLWAGAGPEVAVPATKSYTAQVLVLSLLALRIQALRGLAGAAETLPWLAQIPEHAEAILRNFRAAQHFAPLGAGCQSVLFIGRGADFALALEAALKLKEVAYVHAEAVAAGELKHGGLALLQEGTLVIALITREAVVDDMLLTIRQIKARGGSVLAIAKSALKERLCGAVDELWPLPDAPEAAMPVLGILPAQLLAYHMALARGLSIDQPRHLSKAIAAE